MLGLIRWHKATDLCFSVYDGKTVMVFHILQEDTLQDREKLEICSLRQNASTSDSYNDKIVCKIRAISNKTRYSRFLGFFLKGKPFQREK